MSILGPRALRYDNTLLIITANATKAPLEQTAVVHSNLIRSVGGSTSRDCRHRRPMAASRRGGKGFTRPAANEAPRTKPGWGFVPEVWLFS